MSGWDHGYVSDINYTYGYYGELSPTNLTVPFLMAGMAPPKVGVACELGFGQGLSVNIHAAAQGNTWHATDFNPTQAQFAQMLADASGADAHLVDEAFEIFCSRTDLPQFDYIGLHGIWSWISSENQRILVDFIARKLKVGGVLYISYNTLPGWSAYAPLRHLATEHAKTMSAKATPSNMKAIDSFEFTKKIIESSYNLQKHAPNLGSRIETMLGQNASYLAHEYFNQDWQPMYFSQMTELLSQAKLRFVTCANYLDEYSSSAFDTQQADLLSELQDPGLRETVKDYFLNRQFRKDYWVKGGRSLSSTQLIEYWDGLRVFMPKEMKDESIKLQGLAATVEMMPKFYEPILDILRNQRIYQVKELRASLKDFTAGQLHESLAILISKGVLQLVQDEATISDAEPACHALNICLINENLSNQQIKYLASPVTGNAVMVSFVEQLFIHAYQNNMKKPSEWVSHAWAFLKPNNQKLMKEGQTLETEEENLEELKRLSKNFQSTGLPFLTALKVVE